VVCFLALAESGLDTAYEADVFIDGDAEGEDVLLGLTLVELFDSDLDVGESV